MPRHLISDAHVRINEILTVTIYLIVYVLMSVGKCLVI